MKVSVGRESFEDLRKSGSYYVDKTELLYELFHENDTAVTLFSRPRRFGKTLMLSMLESFLNISGDSRSLFAGLAVSERTEFCEAWQNRYPVLFLSLKDVEGLEFTAAFERLRSTVSDLCKKLAWLSEDSRVNPADRELFLRLMYQSAGETEVRNSLKTLMRMLSAVHGTQVILLIDEYDVPLAKASERETASPGYYVRMLDLLRGFLGTALKTNEYLKAAVVTGCLRIAKESIFTGVNNFRAYSVLDSRYSSCFGFTEEEVQKLLRCAGLEDHREEVRRWYDGYLFGNTKVYCPWDVVNYVSDMMADPSSRPLNYWKNTSGNGIIRTFVDRTDMDVTEEFETLLNGRNITKQVTDELTYDTLHETENHLWSLLLMTGYLTKEENGTEAGDAKLRIPNEEIKSIFRDTVVNWFRDTLDRSRQKELMESFWNEDEGRATELLSDFLWRTISYNDYREDYYHAFLAGLFAGIGYIVESNAEYGLGRPDLLIKDRRNRRAIVIETKRSAREANLEQDCLRALSQIEDRRYAGSIEGYEMIIHCGVAFFRKTAKVLFRR